MWSCGANDNAALGRPTHFIADPKNDKQSIEVDVETSLPVTVPSPIKSLVDEEFRAVCSVWKTTTAASPRIVSPNNGTHPLATPLLRNLDFGSGRSAARSTTTPRAGEAVKQRGLQRYLYIEATNWTPRNQGACYSNISQQSYNHFCIYGNICPIIQLIEESALVKA